MTRSSESKQVARATLWTAVDFILGRGLNILFIAVLARLLTPSDFGTIALLAIFLGVATALVESGFGLALIHNQDTTDEDNSTVFWISLGSASFIALILLGTAPLISTFFELQDLVQLVYIMAFTVWISGFGVVQRALLVKRLAFRQMTIVSLCALAASGLSAVILAWMKFGVFSLAWQGCVSALLTTAMQWALSGWQPKFVFRISSAKRLFGFGGYMLASRLFDIIYLRSYTLLIGKMYGPVELGQFNRAESTAQLASGLIVHPISQIAFPAFSKMRGDQERIREGMKKAVRISMLFSPAAMFSLAATANPFVLTLFGPQWEPSIPFLQVLCLSSVLWPVHVLNLQALMAAGRSDLFFLLEFPKKIVGFGILIVSSKYGTMGIAWGIVLFGLVSFVINGWYSGKLLQYGPICQARQIFPYFVIGAIAALASKFAISASGFETPAGLLAVGIGSSGVTFLLTIAALRLFDCDLVGPLSLSGVIGRCKI